MPISHSRWFSTFVRTPLIGLSTGWHATMSLTVSLFEKSGRRQHRIAQAWARSLLKIAGSPITVVGAENLPVAIPAIHATARDTEGTDADAALPTGPAIYACNHLSYMDTPALYASLPFQFRILARHGLFKIPFLGWHLRRSGQVPVVIGDTHGSLRSLNAAVRTLREGLPLVIFPEGGRSPNGKLQDFLSGLAYMSIRAHVPIVPLALIGTQAVLPMHVYHIRPQPCVLAIGKPISPAGYTMRDIERLTKQVYEAIAELYAQHSPAESASGVGETAYTR
jgi:1-acyl-sn-glycerol-3-phosphate acyltransferase